MKIREIILDLLKRTFKQKCGGGKKLPPISESREAIFCILISVLLTTVDDERIKLTSVMFPFVSKATYIFFKEIKCKFPRVDSFIFHLVCQLILDVTAGDFATSLVDNLLPLIELG